MAAAIPLVIQAGTAIAAHYAAKKAAKSAQERAQARSAEENKALGGAQGAAGTLGQQGSSLFNQGQQQLTAGMPGLEQASNYYSTLLGGNRAAQQQALAAPRASIGDIYRGASRNLERGGLRGAQRDTAEGELAREQAGRLAALTTGVQPMAAEALAGISSQRQALGLQAAGTGAQVTQAGGNLYANLLAQGAQNRQQAVGVGTAAGNSAASTIGAIGAAAGAAYGSYAGGGAGGYAGMANSAASAYGRNIGYEASPAAYNPALYGRPIGYESPPITGGDQRTLSGAQGNTGIQTPYVPPNANSGGYLRSLQQTYRPQGYAGYYYGQY